MRTTEEIVAKIESLKGSTGDLFGATVSDLIDFLSFDDARPYLNPEVTAETWEKVRKPRTPEAVVDAIRAYFPFAWEKAEDERGLSANRSLHHMRAWLWMLGEDAASDSLFEDYYDYGKPQLRAIAAKFGIVASGDALADLPWKDSKPYAAPVEAGDPPPTAVKEAEPEPPAPRRRAGEEPRKDWYGSGEQPWDLILASGWGPAFAAGNVVKYLRRTKAPEHSLESARWYYVRLVEGAGGAIPGYEDQAGRLIWQTAFDRLELILTVVERAAVRGSA